MKIPIVVVNWNGSADTVNCLNSIFSQSYSEYKVYLIDNGSESGDLQVLTSNFADDPRVELILNSKNLGFTAAHNIILSQLIDSEESYEYIFLLNNDTEIHSKCLEEVVRNVKETKADIIACKMLNFFDHSIIDSAGLMMINTGEILPVGSGDDAEKYKQRANVIGASGGAAFYSVAMLKQVGLFDNYFNTGYEDAEFGLRATMAGYTVLYEPAAVVFHKVNRSIDQIRDFDYTVKIQTDVFYTCFKLLPFPVLLLNLPFVLLKYAAVLIISAVLGRFKQLRVMMKSLKIVFGRDFGKIKQNRNLFYSAVSVIGSVELMSKMNFFLLYDIRRFKKYIIDKNRTVFEKY